MQVVQCFGRRMVRDIYGARHRVGRQPSEIASAEQLGTSVLAGRQRRAVGEMNEREVVGAAFECAARGTVSPPACRSSCNGNACMHALGAGEAGQEAWLAARLPAPSWMDG